MATANQNWLSLVPGGNPTGNIVPFQSQTGPSATGTPYVSTPNLSTSSPTSSNPFTTGTTVAVPGSTPSTPGINGGTGATSLTGPSSTAGLTNAQQAAGSPIGGLSSMSPTDISRMYSELKKTYGDGTAHALLNFLTSGAGFNQDAINNLFAAMQPQIERGTENLMEQFSVSGNRFGSGAQIGLADFLSQVNLNQGQIETQMYEQSIQNFLNVLMGTSSANAQTKANSPSMFDSISGILSAVAPLALGV